MGNPKWKAWGALSRAYLDLPGFEPRTDSGPWPALLLTSGSTPHWELPARLVVLKLPQRPLPALQVGEAELRELLEALDIRNTGCIEYDEFLAGGCGRYVSDTTGGTLARCRQHVGWSAHAAPRDSNGSALTRCARQYAHPSLFPHLSPIPFPPP